METTETDVDIYEEMYQASLAELEELNNSEAVTASLEYRLSNTGEPTDYEAWEAGCDQFIDENYEVLRRWVH